MRHTRWIAATVIASASLLGAACTTGGGGYHPPANTPPVAHALATPTSGTASLLVNFDGSTSTDVGGAVIDWAWDFDDAGATASGSTASHTYNTAGTYTVTLTVTDNGSLTDTDTVVITVTAADDPDGRYVATTGTDSGTCSASATPCLTVQYAVDQADASGDTVYVAAGNYPEVVYATKDISFKGANAGISAGTAPGTRGTESAVKGIRTGTVGSTPGTTQYNVNIDGMAIDPQGDAALIAATASPLVWLRGGASATSIVNNVFTGGAFVPNCTYTCTTMTDYAYTVQSGTSSFSNNRVENFRRALNINQPVGAPVTSATVSNNVITGITTRAISLAASTGVQMGGQTVSGNQIDAVGFSAPSGPAGITVSNAGNSITGNTFTSLASGVYIDLCKKFLTNNNSITGNTFTNNGGGININVNTDGGQCVSSVTEGSGGWVTGGGRINGLVVTGNNFEGNTSYAVRLAAYNWGFWNPTAPAVSTGPFDATCNWWNSSAGPTVTTLNYGDPLTPVADQVINSGTPSAGTFTHSPWRTAPAPGGACDGS